MKLLGEDQDEFVADKNNGQVSHVRRQRKKQQNKQVSTLVDPNDEQSLLDIEISDEEIDGSTFDCDFFEW